MVIYKYYFLHFQIPLIFCSSRFLTLSRIAFLNKKEMTKMSNHRREDKPKTLGVEWADSKEQFSGRSGHNIYTSVLLSNNFSGTGFVDKNSALRPNAVICGALDMCKSWPAPHEECGGYLDKSYRRHSRSETASCYEDSLMCYGTNRESEITPVRKRDASARSSVDFALSEEEDFILPSDDRSCFESSDKSCCDCLRKLFKCFTSLCTRLPST